MQNIGLGDSKYRLAVCVPHRPPLIEYQQLDQLRPVQPGEIWRIGCETGNHWRKIFNVFAKLMHEVMEGSSTQLPIWQRFRDEQLLQAGSGLALLFNGTDWLDPQEASCDRVYLITGKQYATEMGWLERLPDQGGGFWFAESAGPIVCPYFDYRQLNNEKITFLAQRIRKQIGGFA